MYKPYNRLNISKCRIGKLYFDDKRFKFVVIAMREFGKRCNMLRSSFMNSEYITLSAIALSNKHTRHRLESPATVV